MLTRSLELSSLPSPVGRRLRTFGHALNRLEVAATVLKRRFGKGQTILGLTPEWVSNWSGNHLNGEVPTRGASPFTASIEQQDYLWLITDLGEDSGISTSWAVVLLLLHLPALREFWRKELRAHRAALLQRVLPRAWPLDPASLPPGAVISGLNLSSWSQLPDLLAKDRSFEVMSLAGDRQPVTASTWPQILAQAQHERLVLLEHRHLAEGNAFRASWRPDEKGWIDLDQQTF
ncbi:MAG: hypothetical protein JNM99_05055 [Verrucomicrobiaceae bacterium]|nr:hypothetical protein [Verrucomicrobiaceae bacterium]